jgi:DNA-binding NarL/FixJ family response regulator
MTDKVMSDSGTAVLVLDDGEAANLDGLATSVAVFGHGQLDLHYATDLEALRSLGDELTARQARAVVVVDADQSAEPKSLLADAADLGFPLVVLSDGRHDAIHDHALSVGATAYLLSALPARELVARLEALAPTAYFEAPR